MAGHKTPPRHAARIFLTEVHGLTRDEAEQALVVADSVLRDGLARLAATVAAANATACREAAHALKGSLLNLGLSDLAALAQTVERAARAGDISFCGRLARHLDQALADFDVV